MSDDEPSAWAECFWRLEREMLVAAGVPAGLLDREPPSTASHLRDVLDRQERMLAPMRERWEEMWRASVPRVLAAIRWQPPRPGHPGGGRAARRRGEARRARRKARQ